MKEPAAREAAIKDELEILCREISTGSIVELPPEPDPPSDETSIRSRPPPNPSPPSQMRTSAWHDRLQPPKPRRLPADALRRLRPAPPAGASRLRRVGRQVLRPLGRGQREPRQVLRQHRGIPAWTAPGAVRPPAIETVVLDWASQVGKTQIGLIFVGFKVHHDPGPILFVEPTENLSKTVANDRIMPMIRDTPVLTPLFSSGRKDPMHLNFPGGVLTSAWASSATELASRAIASAVTDEESRPGYDQNPEGDPVGMLRKRLATFPGRRKHLRISSPGLAKTCRITKAYRNSDQRRYFVPCPQCGEMQVLEFKQLHRPIDPATGRWDNRACYYICAANGCEITHDDKYEMIRQGEWRAENPGGGDGRTAGFHLSALYSTIGYTWSEILDEYDACEGLPDKLQVFQNTVLAEAWDEQAEGADMSELARRAEPYTAPAPGWVLFITCGADVQKDRIEATKWGWGLNEVSGVIEHRIFYGDVLKDPSRLGGVRELARR